MSGIDQRNGDSSLLRRIADGQRECFWDLWSRHEAEVRDLCRIILRRHAEEAEEAMSRVRVQLWDRLPDHAATIRDFEAWLRRFASNVCTDVIRERNREQKHTVPYDAADDVPSHSTCEKVVQSAQRQVALLRSIDALPPRLRQPFILRCVRGMSYREIADLLNLTDANARKRVQQARDQINREWISYVEAPLPAPVESELERRQDALAAEADNLLKQTMAEIRTRVVATRVAQVTLPSGTVVNYHLIIDQKLARREIRVNTLRDRIRKHPTGWKPELELANLLYANGQWTEAAEHYQRVAERKPRPLDIWLRIGHILRTTERSRDAVQAYESARHCARNAATRHHVQGLIELCHGNLNQAVAELRHAISLEPSNNAHRHALARALEANGRSADALTVYDEALQQDAEDIVALTSSHNCLFPTGRFAEARQRLERAVEIDPNFVLALRMLASCRAGTGLLYGEEGKRTEKIIRRALKLAPDAPDVWEAAAAFHVFRGETDQAVALLRHFVDEHPQCAEGWRCYGKWLSAAGSYSPAADAILRALDLDPTDYEIYHQACGVLPLDQRWAALRHIIDTMIKQFSDRWVAYTTAGFALTEWLQEHERASAIAAEAPRLQPALPEAWVRYGWILQLAGRHTEAIAVLERARALIPEGPGGSAQFVETAYYLAQSHRGNGNEASARQWFEQTVRRAPEIRLLNPATAMHWEGKAQEALGDTAAALESYRGALDHHIIYPARQEILDAITRLQTNS